MQIPLPTSEQALPGRDIPIQITNSHFVNGNPIIPPFSEEIKCADFALGCFWGAERKFWEIKNVFSTAVGYMGGFTPNASYEEVCSGLTGHTETVRVFFDDKFLDYKDFKVTLGLNVFNIFDWREPWGVWPLTGLAEDPGEYYMKEVKNQSDGGTLSGSYYDMPWRYSSPREINFFVRFDFN